MFSITISELESLRNIRPVTNISDEINDFEYKLLKLFDGDFGNIGLMSIS